MENKIILFNNKRDCAGCSACMNICPKQAITMKKDENGFIYPFIDESKCIKCGMCKKVCSYQNDKEENKIIKTYASVSKDDNLLKKSSSGGIFGTIAKSFINNSGVVYGCSMEYKDNFLTPMHIRVDNLNDLEKLQGSKYVKSEINFTYQNIKNDLKENNKVLFSGTPCQIAALKSYLKISRVNTNNLFTIDIICHGTPSTKFFQDYVKFLEKKNRRKLVNLMFRDKKYGWNLKGTAFYKGTDNKILEKIFYNKLSSYYNYFLTSKTYRENCYSCKYANSQRVGDITIGDFWGIETEHSEYLKENGGVLQINKGVSCILVNTIQGKSLLKNYGKDLILLDSTFEKAAKTNKQLNHPCNMPGEREKIMKIYREKGYEAVDEYYQKSQGLKQKIRPIYYKIKAIAQRKLGGVDLSLLFPNDICFNYEGGII